MVWDEMVAVGRIVRPQGNRGEVVVAPSTDFGAERFRPGALVQLFRGGEIHAMRVATSREHHGRWVVGFEGIGTIDAAEDLRGLELKIPAEALRPLDDDAHYVHDLIGCQVQTVDGVDVGAVLDVQLDTGIPLIIVGRAGGLGGEVLIPFVAEICRRVDASGRVIVISPPEGLIDLNAPSSGKAGEK